MESLRNRKNKTVERSSVRLFEYFLRDMVVDKKAQEKTVSYYNQYDPVFVSLIFNASENTLTRDSIKTPESALVAGILFGYGYMRGDQDEILVFDAEARSKLLRDLANENQIIARRVEELSHSSNEAYAIRDPHTAFSVGALAIRQLIDNTPSENSPENAQVFTIGRVTGVKLDNVA